MSSDNPFQPPSYHPPQPVFDTTFRPPKLGPVEIEYLRVYKFIFENPNWFMSLLLLAVCQFIPIVGPLVAIGYQFIVTETLHRRTHPTYPDFDFNRFGDYLKRGVWPFLVSLVVALVFVPIMMGGFFLSAMAVGAAAQGGGEEFGGVVAAIVIGLMMLLFMVFGFFANLVVQPMFLRAGLAQDFGQAFNMSFVRDFVARTWKEMTLLWFFFAATGLLVVLAGYALCFVGVYLSIGVLMLSQAHGYFQLYEVYLSRGGMPIPLKPDVPPYAR